MEPKQQPPYPLRMSPELRARLESEAELSRRSLNAEITERLERSIEGGSPSELSAKSIILTLARTENNASVAEVEAQRQMLSGAIISSAFLHILEELQKRGIAIDVPWTDLTDEVERARTFMREADHSSRSGHLEAILSRGERSKSQLLEALEALRAEAEGRLKAQAIAPERTVKSKGSSGVARKIPVTTKTSRKSSNENE